MCRLVEHLELSTAYSAAALKVKSGSSAGSSRALRADIITAKQCRGETLYLIKLREDWDSITTFHLKALSEFVELDARLREASRSTSFETPVFTEIPDLPEQSRLGVRSLLSKVGLSRFLERQQQAVQHYLNVLLAQVSNTAADAHLQEFFSGAKSPHIEELLNRMVLEARIGITLQALKGNWQQKGFGYIWTVDESGKAFLDGQHRGSEYDLMERGDSLRSTISRSDGWQVDIEKSTTNHVFWYLPGEAELEWTRVEDLEKKLSLEGTSSTKSMDSRRTCASCSE